MTGSADTRPRAVVAVPPALREQFFTADAWRRLTEATEVTCVDESRERSAVRRALAGRPGGERPDGARVLVTAWGAPVLDAALLDASGRLGLVAHTGGAVSPYVTPEVFDRGVRVTQAGAAMGPPVAEVALTFTLSLLHRVHRFDHALRGGGNWAAASAVPPRHEIRGCPIGVVGASRTGRAYIGMVRALGAEVTVHDPYLTEDEAARIGVGKAPLAELLRSSRIVAVHAPALPETRHLIGPAELALLPDGAGLVNTARSWLVDEQALLGELRTGRIDAALDVFEQEPLPVDHPLRGLGNVLLTPHQAAATVEGRFALGESTVAEVERFVGGLPLRHAVGPEALQRVE